MINQIKFSDTAANQGLCYITPHTAETKNSDVFAGENFYRVLAEDAGGAGKL